MALTLKHKFELKKDKLVIISSALICLWIILAVVLQRISFLLLVPSVAGGHAQLLHLIPGGLAFAADRVTLAGLLGILGALLNLIDSLSGMAAAGQTYIRRVVHLLHGVVGDESLKN